MFHIRQPEDIGAALDARVATSRRVSGGAGRRDFNGVINLCPDKFRIYGHLRV